MTVPTIDVQDLAARTSEEIARRRGLEATRGLGEVHRLYAVEGIELRAASDPDSTVLDFYGHASVTGKPYEMYGGPDKGGWNETVDPGAFKKTLSEDPDVAFLVNHTGLPLARTKAGNLQLAEDRVGLETKAQLDKRVSLVSDIGVLMETKVMDEMSFAFRIIRQKWLDAEGEEVPWWDMAGIDRHITEVSIHKGDVSLVTYGANPFTDASMRGITLPDRRAFAGALQEVRAGAVLSAATRSTLQTVLDAMSGAEEGLDEAQQTLSDLLGVPNPDDVGEMDGDGVLAAVLLEQERRAFLLKHADI